jgi:ATP-dependent DNA ligase
LACFSVGDVLTVLPPAENPNEILMNAPQKQGFASVGFPSYRAAMSLGEHTRPGLGIIEPCLPSPAERRPSGPGWLHEIKHDGFRIMARRDGAGIRLITRHGNDFTNRFPIIVAAVRALPVQSFLIDGEAISPTATVSPCSTSFATSDMAAPRCSALSI